MIKIGSKVRVLDLEDSRENPLYAPLINRVLTVNRIDKDGETLLYFKEKVAGMYPWRVKEISLTLENK